MEANFKTHIVDTIIQQAAQAAIAAGTLGERLKEIPQIIQQALGSQDFSGLADWIAQTTNMAMAETDGLIGAIAGGVAGALPATGGTGVSGGNTRERPRFGSDAYSGGAGGAGGAPSSGSGASGRGSGTSFDFGTRTLTEETRRNPFTTMVDTADFINEGDTRQTGEFSYKDTEETILAMSEALEKRFDGLAEMSKDEFHRAHRQYNNLLEEAQVSLDDFDDEMIQAIKDNPLNSGTEIGKYVLENNQGLVEELEAGLKNYYGDDFELELRPNIVTEDGVTEQIGTVARSIEDQAGYIFQQLERQMMQGENQEIHGSFYHQLALQLEEDAAEFEKRMQASSKRMADAIGNINSAVTDALKQAVRDGDFEGARQDLLDNFDQKLGDGIIQAAMEASQAHTIAAEIMAEMPRILAEAAESGDYSAIAGMANQARNALGEQFDAMEGQVQAAFAAAGLEIPGMTVTVDEVDATPVSEAVENALGNASERIDFAVQDAFAGGNLDASAANMVADYRLSVIDKVRQMAIETALASTVVAEEMAALEPLISQALETGDWSAVNAEVNGIADGMQSALNNVHEQVTGAINGLDGISLADFLEDGAAAMGEGYEGLESVIANAEQRLAELLQDDNLNASEMFRELATSKDFCVGAFRKPTWKPSTTMKLA